MATHKIKINYFYPIVKQQNQEKLLDLEPLIKKLNSIPIENRIIKDGSEGNIQLKKIEYNESNHRWYLCFLRNRIEAPFITKLTDNTEIAESLDEDEFVGQECCLIYDATSKIIALQNNRSSISISGVTLFFNKYLNDAIYLSAITYKDEYCDISLDNGIEYKSIIIGYTNIDKLQDLANEENNDSINFLAKIATDLSAINGKLELSVGRNKKFLEKFSLKNLSTIFKNNPDVTNTLKVKMLDSDNIRIIDLLNNKAYDDIEICITKSDPKTFLKILNAMDAIFDISLESKFDKCKDYISA